MSGGYSRRPLAEKLGIKEGTKIVVVNAPKKYIDIVQTLPKDVSIVLEPKQPSRFIHTFVTRKRELEKSLPRLARKLASDGTLWVSWQKRSSEMKTDLDENAVRDIGLKSGLVDVKVVAIDETWSGIKFVYRLRDR